LGRREVKNRNQLHWQKNSGFNHVVAGTTNPRSGSKKAQGERSQILRQVTTPLGFYVLTLLILEATLSLVLTCSKLSEDHVWTGFLGMIGMFIGVVTLVTLFVWLKPQNLLFEKDEYLTPELEPSALKDQIEDLIYTNVKQECLKKSGKE
jgi:hypothetical protein